MKTVQIRGAIDLLEESVHLLRRASIQLILQYYFGALPFVIGFLYFWADMSRSPFAHGHVAEASLGVALLYIWMKCWQSVFCANLYSQLLHSTENGYSLRRILRLVIIQMILQPYGLILMPFSLLVFVPFAFFQNLLVLGDGREIEIRNIIRRSWDLAKLWNMQNIKLLMIVGLFTFIAFINIGVLMLLGPQLLKTLLGIETVFTLSGFHAFNTTFLAVVIALTYLCVDPLIAAVYTLRCFYGESIESGADLAAELKSLVNDAV